MNRLVRANADKPHRCPSCHTIPDSTRETGARWTRIHSCDDCHVAWWRGFNDWTRRDRLRFRIARLRYRYRQWRYWRAEL